MLQKELMLPRANNKKCVKVNIERDDDQEDIMNKMDAARQMQNNQNQQPYLKPYEEKMDIEEPKPNLFRQPQYGRKTDIIQPERILDKRLTGKDVSKPRNVNMNDQGFRGREIIHENK